MRDHGRSPRGAVDPEAPDGDLRVLQVDAVGEQRLDVLVVLRLEFGGRGEVIEVLLDQVSHELLIKGQLMVPSDDYLDVVRKGTWEGRRTGRQSVKKAGVKRGEDFVTLKRAGVGGGGKRQSPNTLAFTPVQASPPSLANLYICLSFPPSVKVSNPARRCRLFTKDIARRIHQGSLSTEMMRRESGQPKVNGRNIKHLTPHLFSLLPLIKHSPLTAPLPLLPQFSSVSMALIDYLEAGAAG